MTPSLRERIERIIRSWPSGDDVVENNGANQILLAIKEAMPEKCPNCAFTHLNPQICYGFNQAIEEMERRLG